MINDRMPKVSIMIPVYNQEDYISDAISSSLNINYDSLEIIVLDDCSADNSYNIAKEFEKKSKRVRVYRNDKNLGRNQTYRRLLYDLATGDWVVMLDGDDYFVETDFIKKAVDEINKNKNIVAVLGGYIKSENSLQIKKIPKKNILNGIDVTLKYPNIIYSHGAVLYNRKLAQDIDSYRLGIMSDDLESHLRLFLHGDVCFIDKVIYLWRVNSMSETSRKGYDSYLDNIKTMIGSVYNYATSIYPDRKVDFDIWKRKAFSKLFIIAVSVYAKKEGIGLKKLISDANDRNFLATKIFLSSRVPFILILYYLLPEKIFYKLRDWYRKIRN
ncbi:MAG: glycosyltransferase family 2 protein [Elusimicrobiales bacterium]|jgi:glycosyltransferase involved in cell wall biosynthesis|nr:glycosyltransferase family 2 protein [Elusimicrobiales bacterium]